jgi:23S rRNA (adenine2503-C2)-methyltransferase
VSFDECRTGFGPTVNLPVVAGAGEERLLPGLLYVTEDYLRAWLADSGEKPMRAGQMRHWLLARGAVSFDEMTDIPKALRVHVADYYMPLASKIAKHQAASDQTHKLLVELVDHKLVECVLIQDEGRRTACISTQVGCGMGCVFCASGLDGVDRNLMPAEILEQLLLLRNLPSPPTPLPGGEGRNALERLTHIVVMGMGEPLANLDNLLEALEIATSKDGLGIGARHITISTVGIPVKIRKLADLGKQYHLAVSLHAPNDELRSQIVPTNDKTGLMEILNAAEYFFEKTGRQVTYEYVLLGGVNDAASHARQLAALLKGRRAHVNLIPFNDVEGLPYRRPSTESLNTFTKVLQSGGISVKVRKRKGSQIDAACGQLRRLALTHSPLSPPGERE